MIIALEAVMYDCETSYDKVHYVVFCKCGIHWDEAALIHCIVSSCLEMRCWAAATFRIRPMLSSLGNVTTARRMCCILLEISAFKSNKKGRRIFLVESPSYAFTLALTLSRKALESRLNEH